MTNKKNKPAKDEKETNLTFFRDGYAIAVQEVTDYNTLTPMFKAMQSQYSAVSQLTQSFALRTHQEGKSIKCEKGCAWCCYQPVYMTSQEAILVFEYVHQAFDIGKQKDFLKKAYAKYKKTKGLKEDQKQRVKHACPFLQDGSCSIYPVRPMACRIYLSANVTSCKRKYESVGDGSIVPELFDFILKAGRYMNEGFAAVLKAHGKKIEELTIEEFIVKLSENSAYVDDWLKESNQGDTDQK